jgi:hypothetical protein
MNHTITMWISTFLAVFMMDLCWAIYIRQVDKGNALNAGLWASFLFLTAAVATVSYVSDPWLMIPATAGAFLGTVAGVIKNRRADAVGIEP